jgi:hypothetical protein
MMKRVMPPILAVMLLVGACSAPTPSLPTEKPATATVQQIPVAATSTSLPEQIVQETPEVTDTVTAATPEAACPGAMPNVIGQGIADEYEFASYEEVMSWFCEGAEFEDILVALQTEDQTGVPAEEMLVMLADGLSWEDIWLIINLVE